MAKGDFLDYIVSDNINEYPDDGEQDGFYYEKLTIPDFSQVTAVAANVLLEKKFFGSDGTLQTGNMGGVKFGTVKPTTTSYLSITHNLGVKPKWFVVMGTTSSSSTTHGCAYYKTFNSSYVYVQGYYSTKTKSISTTKNSTSYAYMDASVITVPYYSSSYYWNTSDTYIWAAGY